MPTKGKKILQISAKCSDLFAYTVVDSETNEPLSVGDGYVPEFMPGDHYGDYVMLDIDISTGKIVNWNATKAKKALLAR